MTGVEIIKSAYGNNVSQMARDTGLKYETLNRCRLKEGHLGSMTLNELWLLQRHAHFTDDELLQIARCKK